MLVLMTTISNNIIWSAPKLQQLFIIGKNARTIWLKPFSKMGFRNRHYSWSNYWYNNIPCLASFKIKDYIASFNRNNCRVYFVLISQCCFQWKNISRKVRLHYNEKSSYYSNIQNESIVSLSIPKWKCPQTDFWLTRISLISVHLSKYYQRRIQNPAKHLRWSVFVKQLTASRC